MNLYHPLLESWSRPSCRRTRNNIHSPPCRSKSPENGAAPYRSDPIAVANFHHNRDLDRLKSVRSRVDGTTATIHVGWPMPAGNNFSWVTSSATKQAQRSSASTKKDASALCYKPRCGLSAFEPLPYYFRWANHNERLGGHQGPTGDNRLKCSVRSSRHLPLQSHPIDKTCRRRTKRFQIFSETNRKTCRKMARIHLKHYASSERADLEGPRLLIRPTHCKPVRLRCSSSSSIIAGQSCAFPASSCRALSSPIRSAGCFPDYGRRHRRVSQERT